MDPIVTPACEAAWVKERRAAAPTWLAQTEHAMMAPVIMGASDSFPLLVTRQYLAKPVARIGDFLYGNDKRAL
jgi:hypothetical protein